MKAPLLLLPLLIAIGTPSFASRPCGSADLSFKISDAGVAAGTANFTVVLTNKSESPCSVHGFPKLEAVSKKGKVSPKVSFRHSESIYAENEQPPSPSEVVLRPGSKAAFQIVYSDGTGVVDQSACEQVEMLNLSLGKTTLRIPAKFFACPYVNVSSFRKPWR